MQNLHLNYAGIVYIYIYIYILSINNNDFLFVLLYSCLTSPNSRIKCFIYKKEKLGA